MNAISRKLNRRIDTEEREFVVDYFAEIAKILNITSIFGHTELKLMIMRKPKKLEKY